MLTVLALITAETVVMVLAAEVHVALIFTNPGARVEVLPLAYV
jgi:hypothetical protein